MLKTLLFIDPVTGEKLFYEELWENVSTGTVDNAPWVQPGTPGEAVRALLKAVILGQPLTLFDTDFSVEELDILGGTKTQLAKRICVEGSSWIDTVTMRKEARSQTGFALTLFTSGTTGRAKQFTHSLEGLTRMLKVSAAHESNVWGLAYNPTHIAGVQVILQAFFNGNLLVNLFKASREEIVRALVDHQVTYLSATPSFYRLLLPLKLPCARMRAITLGGERSDAALLAKLRYAFPSARIRNIYASTEMGTLLVAEGEVFAIPAELLARVVVRKNRLWIHRSLLGKTESGKGKTEIGRSDLRGDGGAGWAKRKVESGNEESDGEAGLRSQFSAFSFQFSEWYDTGDDVEIVSDNPLRFEIMVRDRDWVNIGGQKVNPHEVEDLLHSHPDIRAARVFGRKNSVMGQVLCAEVVQGKAECRKQRTKSREREDTPQLNEAHLRTWLAARLQAVKVPRMIRFVDHLGTTRTGKLSRP